ncbi:MAG: cupredoxin domain-containing protein [Herpetosiphonaceae bacterium]|nr:cupredoxin domain-containing protein [Herpetosiphonaceae bacterium]
MPIRSNISPRLLMYPVIGLLLAACGATPATTNQVTATSIAQAAVTPSATAMPSATPSVAPTSTDAPTVTAAPTDTMTPAATTAPTGTSAPTTTMTTPPMPTAVPVQPTPTGVPAAAAPAPTTRPAPASAAAKVLAEIKLFQFKPNVLEIKAGTTVVWTNGDAIEHSVTSGTPPTANGAFDSGFFTQGQSFTFTFTKPGTYSYFCMRHNSMTGTIVVK